MTLPREQPRALVLRPRQSAPVQPYRPAPQRIVVTGRPIDRPVQRVNRQGVVPQANYRRRNIAFAAVVFSATAIGSTAAVVALTSLDARALLAVLAVLVLPSALLVPGVRKHCPGCG